MRALGYAVTGALAVVAVGLLVAAIWTTGPLSDRLMGTGMVALIVAALVGLAVSIASTPSEG
jgi:cytochrome bd-type quinol oxidase subunit 2